MIFDVFAEKGWIWETETVADLLDAQVGLAQVVAYILQYLLSNPFVGSLAGVLLADGCEIFRRDTKLAGLSFHRMALHLVGVQQVEEPLEVGPPYRKGQGVSLFLFHGSTEGEDCRAE